MAYAAYMIIYVYVAPLYRFEAQQSWDLPRCQELMMRTPQELNLDLPSRPYETQGPLKEPP